MFYEDQVEQIRDGVTIWFDKEVSRPSEVTLYQDPPLAVDPRSTRATMSHQKSVSEETTLVTLYTNIYGAYMCRQLKYIHL